MKIIAICGKGGVGKDTILKEIVSEDPSIHKKVSYTTRPPRHGEINGKDYHFVNEDKLVELAFLGELLEIDNYGDYLYGTGLASLDKSKINIGIFSPYGMYALQGYSEEEEEVEFYPILIEATDKTRFKRMLERDKNSTLEDVYNRFKEDEREFSDIKSLENLSILKNESFDDLEQVIDFLRNLKKSLK